MKTLVRITITLLAFNLLTACTEEEGSNPEFKVITNTVTDITGTSAKCGGNITYTGTETIASRGVCWSKNQSPTITDSKTTDGGNAGEFTSTISGLAANTPYFARAYATIGSATTYGNEVSFKTSESTVSYGTVKDFEGNVYKTVKIGTQNWMAENLKSEKYTDGEEIPNITDSIDWQNQKTPAYSYYHNNKAAYKDKYGALYNGFAMTTGKICPKGWHVPTKAEWQTLLDYLAANGYNYDGTTISNKVAVSLAEFENWNYSTGMGCVGNPDYKALHNKSGFSARPAGFRAPILPTHFGSFGFLNVRTSWWTNDLEGAWGRGIVQLDKSDPVVRVTGAMNESGNSCRCIED